VDNYVRLLPYAYGQHINELKHFVYVYYRCGKQFEVAVSLAKILGNPYSKKPPLPHIGDSPHLAITPSLTRYQILGQP
jgi:hypothetical protein